MAAEHVRWAVRDRAVAHPDAVAVVLPDRTVTSFAELQAMAERVARTVPPGRRIAVRLSNTLEAVATVHGVWQAGSSVVSVSPMLPEAEVERRIFDVGACALLEPGTTIGEHSYRPGTAAPLSGEAVIIFTSGTTGRPKGAVTTFSALWASIKGIASGSGLPPEGRAPEGNDRSPRPLFTPLSHMGGFLGHISAWHLGKPLLLCPKFSAEVLFDLAARYRLGTIGLTPAMVWDLAQAPGDRALPGLRSVGVGTAALPEATRIAFEDRFGIPVLRNYGSTEFTGAIAFERYKDVIAGRRPPGSVGKIAPGVQVRLLDGDTEVGPGKIGEIVARGGSTMSGYIDGAGTSGVDHEGWIRTGDLGRIVDEQLIIVGRVKDLIICGGFNVYPAQVETELNKLPEILDSAVAGIADGRLGEVPVAAIVAAQDGVPELETIRTKLRAGLAAYELPRQMLIVDTIPRNKLGKVDRPAVAALFRSAVVGGGS